MNLISKNLYLFLRLFLFSSCYLKVTKGLNCYNCGYIIGGKSSLHLPEDVGNMIDESCKMGSTPKSQFLGPCDLPVEDGSVATCVTLHATGVFSLDIKEAFFRSCKNIPSMYGVPTGCTRLPPMLVNGYLPDSVKNLFTQESNVTGCGCITDGCKAEEKVEQPTTTPSNKQAHNSVLRTSEIKLQVGLATGFMLILVKLVM